MLSDQDAHAYITLTRCRDGQSVHPLENQMLPAKKLKNYSPAENRTPVTSESYIVKG